MMICAVYERYPRTMGNHSGIEKFCRFYSKESGGCIFTEEIKKSKVARTMNFHHDYGAYSFHFYEVDPCPAENKGIGGLSKFKNAEHLDDFIW